jgi:hypothetical protein
MAIAMSRTIIPVQIMFNFILNSFLIDPGGGVPLSRYPILGVLDLDQLTLLEHVRLGDGLDALLD